MPSGEIGYTAWYTQHPRSLSQHPNFTSVMMNVYLNAGVTGQSEGMINANENASSSNFYLCEEDITNEI